MKLLFLALVLCAASLALCAPANRSSVLEPRAKRADMHICAAARIFHIKELHRFEDWEQLKQWTLRHKHGKNKARGFRLRGHDGRQLAVKSAWEWQNWGEASNHCIWHCIGPAVSWGFDSAYCLLHSSFRSMSVSLTPHNQAPCEDDIKDHHHCLWTGKTIFHDHDMETVAETLRDANGTVPRFSNDDWAQPWWMDKAHAGPDTWAVQDLHARREKWNPLFLAEHIEEYH